MAPRRIGLGLIMGLEEKLPSGFVLTTVEKLAGYMRKNSLWPATFGLACCAIEMMAVGSSGMIFGLFGCLLVIGKRLGANLKEGAGLIALNLAIPFLIPGIDWKALLISDM